MIIRINTVCEMTALSRSTIYRLVNESSFPQAKKISKRCVGWFKEDVINWINSRGL